MGDIKELKRMSFQENMELAWLPNEPNISAVRLVSCQPAWKLGQDLALAHQDRESSRPRDLGPGVFGGHVFAQAPLAAARVVEKEDENTSGRGRLGIHVGWKTDCLVYSPLTDKDSLFKASLQTPA